MRKLILPLILIIALFSSCQSYVNVSYMTPSEINMASHRSIAIASAVPYRGLNHSSYIRGADALLRHGYGMIRSTYSSSLAFDIADYATDAIFDALSLSGYYTVTDPAVTDRILDGPDTRTELLERGIDAVIIPRIENMDVNERIHANTRTERRKDKDGREIREEHTTFYYYANYSLTISYTVVDAQTEKVIARRSFVVEDSDSYVVNPPLILLNYPERAFRRMVNSVLPRLTQQLVPLKANMKLSLMDNSPKNADAKEAYDLYDDGNTAQAISIFSRVFEEEGHIPSGYNAALLTASLGSFDEAVEIAERVYRRTGNSKVATLLSTLEMMRDSNTESIRQLTGSDDASVEFEDSDNIYDELRG